MSITDLRFTPRLLGNILRVGYLHKRGQLNPDWQRRLVVLTDRGDLNYFLPPNDEATKEIDTDKQYKGKINCRNAIIRTKLLDDDVSKLASTPTTAVAASSVNPPVTASEPAFGLIFTIKPVEEERVYQLYANTMSERDEWVELISQFGEGPLKAPASLPTQKAKALLWGDKGPASARGKPTSSNGSSNPPAGEIREIRGVRIHAAPSASATAAAAASAAASSSSASSISSDAASSSNSISQTNKELRMLGLTEKTYDTFKGSEKLYTKLGAYAEGGPGAHQVQLDPSVPTTGNDAAAAVAFTPTNISAILAARAAQPPITSATSPSAMESLGTLSAGGQIFTCGYLTKLGGSGGTFASWKKRFFVLTSAGLLHYWEKPEHVQTQRTKGSIDCNKSLIRNLDPQEYQQSNAFSLFPTTVGGKKQYILAAETLADRDNWVQALSHFGEGPTLLSSVAGNKAKDVLFGGSKNKDQGHIVDRLGTSQKTIDKFANNHKAFTKFGVFDETSQSALNQGPEFSNNAAAASGGFADDLVTLSVQRFNTHGNAIPSSSIIKRGFLAKQGGSFKSVHVRCFILTSDKKLFYYGNEKESKPKGVIDLANGATIQKAQATVVEQNFPFSFTVHPNAVAGAPADDRVYVMYACAEQTRDDWIKILSNQSNGSSPSSASSSSAPATSTTGAASTTPVTLPPAATAAVVKKITASVEL